MMKAIIVVAALSMVAGCDAVNEATKTFLKNEPPMTLVFPPGVKLQVGGEVVPVMGTDLCPSNGDGWFGRADQVEAQRGCVVVAPDTASVIVTVMVGGGDWANEIWVVEREGDKTKLRRKDGSYVLAAK